MGGKPKCQQNLHAYTGHKPPYDILNLSLSRSLSSSSTSSSAAKQSPPARKKFHNKTRTGCLKCKERRIKCDEAHPECLRCRKAGFQCRYEIPKAKIFEPSSSLTFKSEIDEQSFSYFVNEGAMVLSTYQPSSQPFWVRIAPQLSHLYPAVKHGILALGSIQGRLAHSSPNQLLNIRRPEISAHAIGHLGKGMKLLSSSDVRSVSTEVSLACCMLFLAVTIWMDRSAAPVVHIDAALRIIQEYTKAVKANPLLRSPVIDDMYMAEYKSLVVGAITLSDGYPSDDSSISEDFALYYGLDRAGSFTSFNYAFNALNNIIRCIIRLSASQRVKRRPGIVAAALGAFSKSLEALKLKIDLHACTRVASRDHRAYRELQMYHIVALVMLDVIGSTDELAYDAHPDDFLFIVIECERLLLEDRIAMSTGSYTLRTSLGLLPPLFFVATKCRNSVIRQKALQVLHAAERSERNWTSCMATTLARFVIGEEGQLEGQSDEEFVSSKQRVRLENVRVSKKDETMYIEYVKGLDKDTSMLQATRPLIPHPVIEQDGDLLQMPKKVLHAYGYTGIILFTPPIRCHCLEEIG